MNPKRPSERITELADQIAAEKATAFQSSLEQRPEPERQRLQELMKGNGERLRLFYRTKPETLAAATAAYLDEQAGFPLEPTT